MSEVRVASVALHFDPPHAVTAVGLGFDIIFINRRPEAWPSGSGIEFCIGTEKLVTATDALIDALLFVVVVFACESSFSSFLSRHLILFRSKLLLPFLVGFDYLLFHFCSFLL